MELEAEMLERIRAAWDQHDLECDQPIKTILLNPGNHELIGWDEVLGLPVLGDPEVEPKRFVLLCWSGPGGVLNGEPVVWDDDGRAWGTRGGRRSLVVEVLVSEKRTAEVGGQLPLQVHGGH